jgi:hypothetical protein
MRQLPFGGNFVYVGNRTDGSKGHPHASVLVVSVDDPVHPSVIGEVGPPHEGNPGETSRELRVWPAARLLLVLNFECDPIIHACDGSAVSPTIRSFRHRRGPCRPSRVGIDLPADTHAP